MLDLELSAPIHLSVAESEHIIKSRCKGETYVSFSSPTQSPPMYLCCPSVSLN